MLNREKVMEGLRHCADRTMEMCNQTCPYYRMHFCETELAADALEMIKKQEQVRCKECSYGRISVNGMIECERYDMETDPGWHCAGGERRKT